jgi:heme-degrading monooxygenase HmoA
MQLLHWGHVRHQRGLDDVVTPERSINAAVRVWHFLHPEGLREFPRVFAEHRRLASAFPGFVALRHTPPAPIDGGAEAEVTIEFETHENLMNWRSSPQHAAIAAAYRQLWFLEPEVTFSKSN